MHLYHNSIYKWDTFAEEMEYPAEDGVADVPVEEPADVVLANYEVDAEEAGNYVVWFTFYEQYGADVMAGWTLLIIRRKKRWINHWRLQKRFRKQLIPGMILWKAIL